MSNPRASNSKASESKDETDNNEPHWACGKIDCDCDEQYEQWKDEQLEREEYAINNMD